MLLLIDRLSWHDLDPASRDFDAEPARAVATACIRAALEGGGDVDKVALQEAIATELTAAYGCWVAGWSWAVGKPGGGTGPGWCCASHSLLVGADPDGELSVGRVVVAVTEWHHCLTQLAGVFDALQQTIDRLPIETGAERAAAELLPLILERTSAEDAWFSTFGTVLTWFLESIGHDREAVGDAVSNVVDGHFDSWVQPEEPTMAAACAALGREVDRAAGASVAERDALARWRSLREEPVGPRYREVLRRPVTADAHRAYIERFDRPRGDERADGLCEALQLCRRAAVAGEPLTFERLALWQRHVLGGSTPTFRTDVAYAKNGRERYGWKRSTATHFDTCLAQAMDPQPDPTVRAARAYLDVCFFHPFDDGNARAARLVLEYVLMRAGLALHTVAPVFVMSRSVTDSRDVRLLWLVVEQLAGRAAFGE